MKKLLLALALLAGFCLAQDPLAYVSVDPSDGVTPCSNNGVQVVKGPSGNMFTCDTTAFVWRKVGPSAATTVKHNVSFVIDGGGSAITTGACNLFIPVRDAGTIQKVELTADQSGSITVDIWKKAAAIPGSGDKISASAPATLSSAQINQTSSLTGWTTSVSANDVFGCTVATVSTVQRVLVQVWYQ